ncbi:MAG TPA: hypothetical protein VN667_01155 [Burkholderiales bacterium]|nr:hypothetical protein [Burkholderiales bacterium]
MRGGLVRLVAGVVAALLLAGCYPELDWRPLNSAQGRFTVLMPAKTKEDSRPVAEGVTMHQWATGTSNALFAAAYADYPTAAQSHMATVQSALIAKGGRLAEERELRHEGLVGHAFIVEFPADKSPPMLHVRLLASGNRLYQLSVLTRGEKPGKDDIELFFDSFHVTNE